VGSLRVVYETKNGRMHPLKKEYKKKSGRELSRATLRAMENRNTLWRRYRQFPSGRNFELYRRARNKVNGMVRRDIKRSRKKSYRVSRETEAVLWLYAVLTDGQGEGGCTEHGWWRADVWVIPRYFGP